MSNIIAEERLEKEFKTTGSALEMAKSKRVEQADERLAKASREFLDMAERYYNDAVHFRKKGDLASAFGALNYAHGWLDAGARLGFWDVKGQSNLFVVD